VTTILTSPGPDFRFRGLLVAALCAAAVVAGGALAVAGAEISPWLALLALVGGLVTLAILWSPSIGLLAVAATIPLERLGRLTDDFDAFSISLSRIVGLIALGGFLLHAVLRRWKVRLGVAFWLYAGYSLLAVLSVAWSNFPEDTRRDALRIVGNLLFFFLIVNIARDPRLVRLAVAAWLVASIGTAVHAIYDYHLGQSVQLEESEVGTTSTRFSTVVRDDSETRTLGEKVRRAFGPTSHPTLFGLNLTMTLPFFAYLLRTRRSRWSLLWLVGMGIVCYGIVLSNTRAVMLLAGVTLFAIGLRGFVRPKPATLLALAVGAASILPFIPQDVYMRTLDPLLYTTAQSDSIRIRFKYWEKSFELIEQNFATGIGVGDQDTIVNMVTDEISGRITPGGLKASAHNEYIWTLVELGLPGFLLHWFFVGWVVWSSFRAARYFRGNRALEDLYWLMAACQLTLVGILLFAVQTEVFHFSLKGWWMAAGISVSMLVYARRFAAVSRSRDAAGAATPA
jgi:hypothetical protein